jgi:hypothetical protein
VTSSLGTEAAGALITARPTRCARLYVGLMVEMLALPVLISRTIPERSLLWHGEKSPQTSLQTSEPDTTGRALIASTRPAADIDVEYASLF